MERLQQLRTFIGEEKTLVIACNECGSLELNADNIITILTLCNCLHPHDYDLRGEIKTCISQFQCSKIVVMGHYDCKILHHILTMRDPEKPIQAIQNRLVALADDMQHCKVKPGILLRMIVELNVIEQMDTLMGYYFVRRLLKERKLTITGAVIDRTTNKIVQLYKNGWSCNALHFLN